ncbi:hypothetical protein [Paenibacillus daejeonensis]|uniref:hypothetical protein n=1 Tax=Paenibacillus daejeonensis TaxID=135193 RepID=UPI000360D1F1|nr:hypothetical protein [Paenibacillus daejeonensis]
MNLADTKLEVKRLIRTNSDRGFLPYGGCNRVCHDMIVIVGESRASGDVSLSLDIHLYILTEVIKLISHADSSSGAITDVVGECIQGIETMTKSISNEDKKSMFQKIIKTAKHKAFQEWSEFGYRLLRSAAHVVENQKQAATVHELFDVLGLMYGDKAYPDQYIITHQLIEQLEGNEAAERYQMEHLHIPEMRTLVVERAIAAEQYETAEKLCLEVLQEGKAYGKSARWAYYLEHIYTVLGNRQKQIDMTRLILMGGEASYYRRLKELYQTDGVWEEHKEGILRELSQAYIPYEYAVLLADEGEWERLLAVVQKTPMFIEHYGKQLAKHFPSEAYQIFEGFIVREAAAASTRGKYKGVCKLIRKYHGAGAKQEAAAMIHRLIEQYPRRVAMVDELEMLEKKLVKS